MGFWALKKGMYYGVSLGSLVMTLEMAQRCLFGMYFCEDWVGGGMLFKSTRSRKYS